MKLSADRLFKNNITWSGGVGRSLRRGLWNTFLFVRPRQGSLPFPPTPSILPVINRILFLVEGGCSPPSNSPEPAFRWTEV